MKDKIHCQQNSSQNRAKYMYMQSVLFQLLGKNIDSNKLKNC